MWVVDAGQGSVVGCSGTARLGSVAALAAAPFVNLGVIGRGHYVSGASFESCHVTVLANDRCR